jgi:flagellar basal body-associated protein FliL
MINKLLMLIMVNMLLLMIMVSLMSGNTRETTPDKPKELALSKKETEIFTATKSPTEINLTIKNSKIKMMLMMISLITTDLLTNGKTRVILLKLELLDHHSALLKFKT